MASELTCYTNDANGVIKLVVTNPSDYYNGKAQVSGSDLLNHLGNMISSLKLDCDGSSCTMKGRFNLNKRTFFIGGRFEPGFDAYPEGNGLKLFKTYDGRKTGENWFFNNCY